MSQPLRVVPSIHDVTPENLPRVRAIIAAMEAAGLPPATLLVVPGKEWGREGLDELRQFCGKGHALAGHGWSHEAPRVAGVYHRLYSLIISRRAAEHLALDRDGVLVLLARTHAWFIENRLPPPQLYVPPAWALGPISREALRNGPYCYYETLTGVYDAGGDRFTRLPLAGYEADTFLRALLVRSSNAANLAAARVLRRPLRLSIHPCDLKLRLGGALRSMLESEWEAVRYEDL